MYDDISKTKKNYEEEKTMITPGRGNFIITVLCALLCVVHSVATADEIILQNGDRLTGKVTKMENNKLMLETEYSSPIEINKSMIRKISINDPVDLHLSGGEVLKGALKAADDGRLVIDPSEDRGDTYVEWENVSAINPPPVPESKWKGNINVGAGVQSGNTDRKNASAGAEAKRVTEKDRFGLRFLYNYAEEDKEVSSRNT
jgi:hypothetical protein